MTLVPDEELAVGRSYTAFYDVRDYAGNSNRSISFSFTTSFVPDGESPLVENFSVLDGLENVPTNALLQIEFDEAVNVLRLAGIRLYQDAEEVLLQSRTLSSNGEVVTLGLSQLLEPSSSYTIEVNGVEDLAGNVLTAQVSNTFETGSGTDLVNPTRVEITPLSRSTISTDGNLAIRYSERLTPLTVSGQVGSYRLFNNDTRQDEPVSAILSSDGRTVELTATEGLQPNTTYSLIEDEFRDLSNNRVNGGFSLSHLFFTGSGPSNGLLQVEGLSINDGLTDVALNGQLWVGFASQLDTACANTSTVSLIETDSGNVLSGSVVLSSDRTAVRFEPDDTLSAQTSYTLELNGLCDVSGNEITGYSTSYVTGTETNDTTRPRVSTVEPCLLYTSPSPRDRTRSRMPSSA